jgi:hypothetical protein
MRGRAVFVGFCCLILANNSCWADNTVVTVNPDRGTTSVNQGQGFQVIFSQVRGSDVVWHRAGERSAPMRHAYWGPSFGEPEIEALLADRRQSINAAGCTVRRIIHEDELLEATARAIADGLVVG